MYSEYNGNFEVYKKPVDNTPKRKRKKLKIKITVIVNVIVAVVCLALSVTCLYTVSEFRALKQRIEVLDKRVHSADLKNNKLTSELKSYKDKYLSIPRCYDKARIADYYLVYVSAGGRKYHKLECSYFNSDNSSVYWRDAAVSRGFTPCLHCFKN